MKCNRNEMGITDVKCFHAEGLAQSQPQPGFWSGFLDLNSGLVLIPSESVSGGCNRELQKIIKARHDKKLSALALCRWMNPLLHR